MASLHATAPAFKSDAHTEPLSAPQALLFIGGISILLWIGLWKLLVWGIASIT